VEYRARSLVHWSAGAKLSVPTAIFWSSAGSLGLPELNGRSSEEERAVMVKLEHSWPRGMLVYF
jgi:hypothetical protein